MKEFVVGRFCWWRAPPYLLYFVQQYGLLSGLVEKLWEKSNAKAYGPLIKSPTENLPQDTQQEESSAKGENSR